MWIWLASPWCIYSSGCQLLKVQTSYSDVRWDLKRSMWSLLEMPEEVWKSYSTMIWLTVFFCFVLFLLIYSSLTNVTHCLIHGVLKSILGIKKQFYHHAIYSIMRSEIYNEECLVRQYECISFRNTGLSLFNLAHIWKEDRILIWPK